MPSLIYIHGFLSSPLSSKAVKVRDWLSINRPDITYHCPFLTPYFGDAKTTLEALVDQCKKDDTYLVGSSLGGYWATYLAEKYDLRAVLINPAVNPSVLNDEYFGVELKNYHTDDYYILEPSHIEQLLAADTPTIHRHNNYWLMVQTGDETLDYRLAVEKYSKCRQLVEQGGDHSFRNFETHIPEIISFLENP